MTTAAQTVNRVVPFEFGRALSEPEFLEIQTRMALECCKWDIQIGDTVTLFRQPLVINSETWRLLSQMAEALTAELMAAEREIIEGPELYPVLGLPPTLHPIFLEGFRSGATPAA